MFEKLYIHLNKLHNVNLSKNQWQVILGEWLRQFIYIIYNNYFKLKKNVFSKKFIQLVYQHNKNEYIPSDLVNLNKLYNNTIWNEKLNGQILDFLNLKKKKIKLNNKQNIKIKYKKPKKENFILKSFRFPNFLEKIYDPFIQKHV